MSLRKFSKKELTGCSLDENDILIDIPGRKLEDDIGEYYIGLPGSDGHLLGEFSSPFY